MISHSCKISGRVEGTSTSRTSGSVGDGLEANDIRVRSLETSSRERARPRAALMYVCDASVARGCKLGLRWEDPSGMWILTGSIENGMAQYSANMVDTILMTMSLWSISQ